MEDMNSLTDIILCQRNLSVHLCQGKIKCQWFHMSKSDDDASDDDAGDDSHKIT